MSKLSTHVLDTSRGRPASGIPVSLERRDPDGTFRPIGSGVTDADGRLKTLLPASDGLPAGIYRLGFEVAAYFAASATPAFFPSVAITFEVRDADQHHHVPLLLSPFGYSTYRGS
jgi:5-hydroxyisourate hydrolase